MTKSGRREFLRRIIVMVLLVSGLSAIGFSNYLFSTVLIASAVSFYMYLPAVSHPRNVLLYDAGSSQTVPDWLGFIVSSLFFAGPIWASIAEPNWGTVHPSSVLLWPMALISSSIWIIGALNASYWIVIKPKTFSISTAFGKQKLSFDTIHKARPYRKGLPQWLYFLLPLMILKGQFSGGGALLLAQDRTGMELILKNGKSIAISDSDFDVAIIKILQALDQHHVKLAATYQKRLKRAL